MATVATAGPVPAHGAPRESGSPPPALIGWSSQPLTVDGTYRPFTGDFDADGHTDIFWYAPGTGADSIWLRGPMPGHVRVAQRVASTYQPVVGDFVGPAGTTGDDIVWDAAGRRPDYLWTANGDGTFSSLPMAVAGDRRAFVGDFTGDAHDDIYWFSGVAGGTDQLSRANGDGTFTVVGSWPTVVGAQPLVGRFTIARPDILFYVPGPGSDPLVEFDGAGVRRTIPQRVDGEYLPGIGDLHGKHLDGAACQGVDQGDGVDDILWYGDGQRDDFVWWFPQDGSGHPTSEGSFVQGHYRPLMIDWHAAVDEGDCITRDAATNADYYDHAGGWLDIGG